MAAVRGSRGFQRPMDYVPPPAESQDSVIDIALAMKRELGLESDDDDDDIVDSPVDPAQQSRLVRQVSELQQELAEGRMREQEHAEAMKACQDELAEAQRTVQLLQTQRRLSEAGLGSQLKEAKQQAREYRQVVTDLEAQIKSLSDADGSATSANTAAMTASKAQQLLQATLDARTERVAVLEDQLKTAQEQVALLEAERAARVAAETDVASLRKQVQQASGDEQAVTAALQQQQEHHAAELGKYQRALERAKKQLEDARSNSTCNSSGGDASDGSKPQLGVKELKKACQKLLKENKRIKTALSERESQITALEQQLWDVQQQATAVPAPAAATATTTTANIVASLEARSAHLHAKLIEAQEDKAAALAKAQADHAAAMAEAQAVRQREIKALQEQLTRASGELKRKTDLAGEVRQMQLKLADASRQLVDVRQQVVQQSQTMQKQSMALAKSIPAAAVAVATRNDTAMHEAMVRYRKEAAERRKLYNQLQEMRGNIRVYCRVRPLSEREMKETPPTDGRPAISYPEDGVIEVYQAGPGKVKRFEFEHVFSPAASQADVFADMAPLISSVLDGYNVCIFAYGQTGSGKTHTMMGPPSDPGVNNRALNQLFATAKERCSDWSLSVVVSVLEIYNEGLYDLLAATPEARQVKLDVQQSSDGMHVPGVCEVGVSNTEDVMDALARGMQNRATSATNMNEHSSRSHLLLRVLVTSVNTLTGASLRSRMTLVDLAGSERVDKSGATSDAARLREAQNINKSLSALGDVIKALAGKQSHVPYRNTKLTYLLQDSLGGNSKTLMFCAVNPAHSNVVETISSLQFASRVRTVELGRARRNTIASSAPGSPASSAASSPRTPRVPSSRGTPMGTPTMAAKRIRQA